MLDPKDIEAEIATLYNVLDGVKNQKVRVVIVSVIEALKWVLQEPHSYTPSQILSLIEETHPYPLSADTHSDAELN